MRINYSLFIFAICWQSFGNQTLVAVTNPLVGAKCDGINDDTNFLEEGLKKFHHLLIPKKHNCVIHRGIRVPSDSSLVGEEKNTSVLTNTYLPKQDANPPEIFWTNALIIGNWGGEGSPTKGALWVPPYRVLKRAFAGDFLVVLYHKEDVREFNEGDIVAIKSAETFSFMNGNFYMPKYVQLNRVKSFKGKKLLLEYPLNHNFGTISYIADLSTASATTGKMGLDGEVFYIAENVEIGNLTIVSNVAPVDKTWSVFHLSGYKVYFHDLRLISKRGPGANPCGYSNFENISVEGINETPVDEDDASAVMGFEIAHLSNNVLLKGIHIDRGSLNIGETGSYVTVKDSFLGDGRVLTSRKHFIEVDGLTIQKTTTTQDSPASFIVNGENEYTHINRLTILDPGENIGVLFKKTSRGARLTNSLIWHRDKPAYKIEPGADPYLSNVEISPIE